MSSPLDIVLKPEREAIIALEVNGEPLPIDHGFPARIIIPGFIGGR